MKEKICPLKLNMEMTLRMSRYRALQFGLLSCACGHRENNHFSYDKKPCAHCGCKEYSKRGVYGVEIVKEKT